MAGYSDFRLRLLAIERIISKTPKNCKQIQAELENVYSIQSDRKTIYKDIDALTTYMPIAASRQGYYLGEWPE